MSLVSQTIVLLQTEVQDSTKNMKSPVVVIDLLKKKLLCEYKVGGFQNSSKG